MRLFAAASPDDDSATRKAVPTDILRRLAFGRPQRRPSIPPEFPVTPVPPAPAIEAAPAASDDSVDLDQRVRQSGEW